MIVLFRPPEDFGEDIHDSRTSLVRYIKNTRKTHHPFFPTTYVFLARTFRMLC
jgi:hypothetical protein